MTLPADVKKFVEDHFREATSTRPTSGGQYINPWHPGPVHEKLPLLKNLKGQLDRLEEHVVDEARKDPWFERAIAVIDEWASYKVTDISYRNIRGLPDLYDPLNQLHAIMTRLLAVAGADPFKFLTDPKLNGLARNHSRDAEKHFAAEKWKDAAREAGGAIEAMVGWSITEIHTTKRTDYDTGFQKAFKGAWTKNGQQSHPPAWITRFVDQLRMAREIGLITYATWQAADAGREYRNYVHPMKAATAADPSRAMAMVALGAMELVREELEAKFP